MANAGLSGSMSWMDSLNSLVKSAHTTVTKHLTGNQEDEEEQWLTKPQAKPEPLNVKQLEQKYEKLSHDHEVLEQRVQSLEKICDSLKHNYQVTTNEALIPELKLTQRKLKSMLVQKERLMKRINVLEGMLDNHIQDKNALAQIGFVYKQKNFGDHPLENVDVDHDEKVYLYDQGIQPDTKEMRLSRVKYKDQFFRRTDKLYNSIRFIQIPEISPKYPFYKILEWLLKERQNCLQKGSENASSYTDSSSDDKIRNFKLGEKITKNIRLMRWMLENEQWLDFRTKVENCVEIGLKIAKIPPVQRTQEQWDIHDEHQQWVIFENLMDTFEKYTEEDDSISKIDLENLLTQIDFNLSEEMPAKKMMKQLRKKYNKTIADDEPPKNDRNAWKRW